jgi:hypothetical protein
MPEIVQFDSDLNTGVAATTHVVVPQGCGLRARRLGTCSGNPEQDVQEFRRGRVETGGAELAPQEIFRLLLRISGAGSRPREGILGGRLTPLSSRRRERQLKAMVSSRARRFPHRRAPPPRRPHFRIKTCRHNRV